MPSSLKSLIVDTDDDSLIDVAQAANDAGLTVYPVRSYGREALVSADEVRPHVVMLALDEPLERSMQTLADLRFRHGVPVIAYTSDGTSDLAKTAMRAGARDILVRPLTVEAVHEAVHTALAREELRQVGGSGAANGHGARGTIVTVAGAKGGTGKSTIAVNLAIALRQVTGESVALLDSDAQFGDVASMLGLDVERSVADLARLGAENAAREIDSHLQRHRSGIDVLPAVGDPDDWRAVAAEHVTAIMRVLAESYEFVVVDTPGTMSEPMAAAVQEASLVLMVTNRDVASVKDSVTTLCLFDHWSIPRERVRLVVNDNAVAGFVSSSEIAAATEMEIAAEFSYQPSVLRSAGEPDPVLEADPRGRFARSARQLAERVSGVTASSRPTILGLLPTV